MSDDPSTDYDQREQLFDRAKVGEITGDEADAEAIRLGLGSLSSRPGREAFRPEALPDWTLPMTLAWIVYLDLEQVREWHTPYRADCWHWVHREWQVGFDGPVHAGWLLEQRPPPTLSLFSTSLSVDRVDNDAPQPTMSAREARESLWARLREGFVKASGIDLKTGRRREIPALDWHELVPVGRDEVDEVRHGLLGEGYRDVLLPSAIVRSYWRRVEKPTPTLPPIMPPAGFGYMPLFCAAQWIATEGGQIDFEPSEVERWRPAYAQLLDAISSGVVKVVGVEGHRTSPVPSHLFVGIEVDYPYAETTLEHMVSNELVLRSYPYVDEQHWRNGFDDGLSDRGGDRWVRLSVEKSGVRTTWPFNESPPPKSGTPGRPTSAHLFKAEMERRAECGDLSPTLAAETRYLSKWLQDNHPTMPQARPGSIEEVIRIRYWELRGQN